MIDPNVFNEVPLFALLDAEEREVLAQQVSTHNIAAGECLFKSGEPGKHAYLVQYGRVNLTLMDIAGDVIEVDTVEAGGLLGMSSLLAGTEHLTTAMAAEDTCLIEIDRSDITTLLQKKPLAGLDMMTMIGSAHELMRLRATRNPNVEIEEAETLGDRRRPTQFVQRYAQHCHGPGRHYHVQHQQYRRGRRARICGYQYRIAAGSAAGREQ